METLRRPRKKNARPRTVDIIAVRERQRKRRRATDNLAGGVVLRAVARADVLKLGAVPRDDAAEVGANGVDGVVLERLVLLHDEVVGVALEALHKCAVRVRVSLGPRGGFDIVAERVLCDKAGAATNARWRDKEVHKAASEPQHRHASTANKHKVHDRAALHVRHEVISSGRHLHWRMARLHGAADIDLGGHNQAGGRGEGAEEKAALHL
mmetsp:Transcript_11791/g.25504  ORF Transcript_11791/g.25504 Transcript_11791/m.25504 type:complete len:210 (+) Transcript_11791:609-1238(+)